MQSVAIFREFRWNGRFPRSGCRRSTVNEFGGRKYACAEMTCNRRTSVRTRRIHRPISLSVAAARDVITLAQPSRRRQTSSLRERRKFLGCVRPWYRRRLAAFVFTVWQDLAYHRYHDAQSARYWLFSPFYTPLWHNVKILLNVDIDSICHL